MRAHNLGHPTAAPTRQDYPNWSIVDEIRFDTLQSYLLRGKCIKIVSIDCPLMIEATFRGNRKYPPQTTIEIGPGNKSAYNPWVITYGDEVINIDDNYCFGYFLPYIAADKKYTISVSSTIEICDADG